MAPQDRAAWSDVDAGNNDATLATTIDKRGVESLARKQGNRKKPVAPSVNPYDVSCSGGINL